MTPEQVADLYSRAYKVAKEENLFKNWKRDSDGYWDPDDASLDLMQQLRKRRFDRKPADQYTAEELDAMKKQFKLDQRLRFGDLVNIPMPDDAYVSYKMMTQEDPTGLMEMLHDPPEHQIKKKAPWLWHIREEAKKVDAIENRFFDRSRHAEKGALVSSVLLGIAGAIAAGRIGVGKGPSRLPPSLGFLAGGFAGAGLNQAGKLLATLTAARTREQQRTANRRSLLWSYLVPGLGGYDYAKNEQYIGSRLKGSEDWPITEDKAKKVFAM